MAMSVFKFLYTLSIHNPFFVPRKEGAKGEKNVIYVVEYKVSLHYSQIRGRGKIHFPIFNFMHLFLPTIKSLPFLSFFCFLIKM